MKVKVLQLMVWLLAPSLLLAQNSLTGKWTGKLFQDAGGFASEYYFELNIEETDGSVTGTSFIRLDKATAGMMQVEGSFDGKLFVYEEPRILNQSGITDTSAWCLKHCELEMNRKGDELFLKGTWIGSTRFGSCSPGIITLSRYAPAKLVSELSITVIDKKSKDLLKSTIQIGKAEDRKTAHVIDGKWKGVVPKATQYQIVVQAEGYYAFDSVFQMKDEGITNLVCALKPVHKGDVFEIEHLYFEQSEATITPDSEEELNKLADFLLSNPGITIDIVGHTDSNGSSYLNKVLSIKRARAVMDYLIAKGIRENRLTSHGFGEDRPIASNETAEGQAKNRRVEVEILGVE